MLPMFRIGIALLLSSAALSAQGGQFARDFSAQSGDGQALQVPTDADVCNTYLQNINKLAETGGPLSCGRQSVPSGTELRAVHWQPVKVVPELAYVLARVRQPDEALWPESYKSLMTFSASWTPPTSLAYEVVSVSLNNAAWLLLRVAEQRSENCENTPDGSGGRRPDRFRYYLFPGGEIGTMTQVDPKKVVDLQAQGSGIGAGYGDAFFYRGRIYVDKLRSLGEGYSLTLSELSFVPYLDRAALADVCAFNYK